MFGFCFCFCFCFFLIGETSVGNFVVAALLLFSLLVLEFVGVATPAFLRFIEGVVVVVVVVQTAVAAATRREGRGGGGGGGGVIEVLVVP